MVGVPGFLPSLLVLCDTLRTEVIGYHVGNSRQSPLANILSSSTTNIKNMKKWTFATFKIKCLLNLTAHNFGLSLNEYRFNPIIKSLNLKGSLDLSLMFIPFFLSPYFIIPLNTHLMLIDVISHCLFFDKKINYDSL